MVFPQREANDARPVVATIESSRSEGMHERSDEDSARRIGDAAAVAHVGLQDGACLLLDDGAEPPAGEVTLAGGYSPTLSGAAWATVACRSTAT